MSDNIKKNINLIVEEASRIQKEMIHVVQKSADDILKAHKRQSALQQALIWLEGIDEVVNPNRIKKVEPGVMRDGKLLTMQ